jgi:hypothetical protein
VRRLIPRLIETALLPLDGIDPAQMHTTTLAQVRTSLDFIIQWNVAEIEPGRAVIGLSSNQERSFGEKKVLDCGMEEKCGCANFNPNDSVSP